MFKRIALVMAILFVFVMVTSIVMADDKPAQKDNTACTMQKDGKCTKDANTCPKVKEAGCCAKDKADPKCCPRSEQAKQGTCKESCKSTCPAQAECKATEPAKK